MKKSFSYPKASHLASLWNRKLGATRKWHIIMITLNTARDGDRRTWQMTKATFHLNFAWTFRFRSVLWSNCSVGDPALTKRIEGLGTRMRWLEGGLPVVFLCGFAFTSVFRFSVSMTERVWDERKGGWDETSPHRSLRLSLSERLRGSTKRKWKETRYFQQSNPISKTSTKIHWPKRRMFWNSGFWDT